MKNEYDSVFVYAADDAARKEADAFSVRTGIPMGDLSGDGVTLCFAKDGLSLFGYGLSYRGDFAELLRRVTGGRLAHEMLVHVSKTKEPHPCAVDATAGMGEDSFLLAAAGYDVTLFEQNAVIAALLRDALRRAAEDPALAPIVERMHLVEGDSIKGLGSLSFVPDLIYLDPMFPPRQKSGLIRKKLQLIQKLERPCSAEEELFRAALGAGPKKIVVKRPLKGAVLAGRVPSYTAKGKAIRYDCYVFPGGAGHGPEQAQSALHDE